MKRNKIIIIYCLVFLCIIPLTSSGDFTGNAAETKKIAPELSLYPRRNRLGKSLLTAAGAALLAGIILKNDKAVYRGVQAYHRENPWVRDISPKIALLGDRAVNLGFIASFYLSGFVFREKKIRQTAGLSFQSYLYTTAAVEFLKRITGRRRPGVSGGEDYWGGPSSLLEKDHNSFPSAHTAIAWSTAAVIAHRYNKSWLVPAISYSLAGLVGLSRVTEKKHWFSDAAVGALVGFAIGKFVVKQHRKGLNIFPYIKDDKMGLALIIPLR